MGVQTEKVPDVSVIICHHIGRLIERCLASVLLSEGVSYEVLIITSDDTYSTQQAEVYFLEDGPAGKRNFGVRHAKGELLVFLDDDVEISLYCLYEFKRWMEEHPKCGMAFGKIYKMAEGRRRELDDCGSWLTWTGFLYSRAGNALQDTGRVDRATRCLAGKSATCIVRRTAFSEAGGFDRNYYILGEETDLAWRVWLQGLEVWYVPTAHSWHAFGCSELKPKQDYYSLRRVHYLGCRNYLNLLLTNLGVCRLLCILPVHATAWCVAAVGFLMKGDWPRCRLILSAIWSVARDWKTMLTKRQKVQRTRVVSDRDLFQYIYYSPPFTYYLQRMERYWTSQLHG